MRQKLQGRLLNSTKVAARDKKDVALEVVEVEAVVVEAVDLEDAIKALRVLILCHSWILSKPNSKSSSTVSQSCYS
jgi:hypothetical protein